MQPKLRVFGMGLFVIILLLVTTPSHAQTPIVQTDSLDYHPGSTVAISGSGFQPGETVILQVLHTGDGDNDASDAHAPWNVIANDSGNIIATWIVPLDEDELGATLLLTADGETSSLHAEEYFTDATITITGTNVLWSSITNGTGPGGQPGSGDAIVVKGGGSLIVDVSNAVCLSIQLGESLNTALPNNNSGNGALTFNAGSKLSCEGNVTVGETGTTGAKGTLNMNSGGTLQLKGALSLNFNHYSFDPGSGTSGGTIEFNAAGLQNVFPITYNNLTLSGSGKKSLTNTTNAGGMVTIKAGAILDLNVLNLGSTTAPTSVIMETGTNTASSITGTSGKLFLGGNVTVNKTGTGAIGASISAPVSLNAIRTFNVADGNSTIDLTMSGIVSGTGGIIKSGAGTMVLSAVNSYTGTTTASAGFLSLAGAGGNNTIVGDIDINGGTLNYSNGSNEQISDNSNITLTSGILDFGARTETIGSLSMTGGNLIKGSSVLTIKKASSITGGTVNYSSSTASLSLQSTLTLGGAIFNYNSASAGKNNLNLGGNVTYEASNTAPATFINSGAGIGELQIGAGSITRIFDIAQTSLGQPEVKLAWTLASGNGTTSFVKSGNGTLLLLDNFTYSGTTTISAGELRLNPTNDISPRSNIILDGGKLSTVGIASGRAINDSGTLTVKSLNSIIDLDAANEHTLKFRDSRASDWAGTLAINYWQGVGGYSGTAGKIFIGASSSALTATQLSKIIFTGFNGTPILSALPAGELFPAVQNLAPSVADVVKFVREDDVLSFQANDFTASFSDPDNNSLSKIKILSLPLNGTLKIGENNAVVNDEVLAVDLSTITFVPDADYNGSVSFSWNGNDGTVYAATPANVTVSISPVNDAPVFTKGTDQVIGEDAVAQTVNGWATGISAGPANESLQSLNFHVSNDNNNLFLVQPSIDASGNLTYTVAANANGSAVVTVYLTDDGETGNGGIDQSASQMFTITVIPVNDEPAGMDATININEDCSFTFNEAIFGFSDPNDAPANSLAAVKITTVPSSGTLKLSGANVSAGDLIPASSINNLVYTPALNENGSPYATFTFQVQDNGGTDNSGINLDQLPNTITFNVAAVNDAPVVSNNKSTQNVQYSDAINRIIITTDDADGDKLIISKYYSKDGGISQSGLPNGITLTQIGSTGNWAVDGHAVTAPGTYEITITAKDPDNAEGSTTVEIIVTSEDARITYTGAVFSSTTGASSSTATVTLAATIQDISATTDAGADTDAGDVRNARVYFKIVETNQTIGPLFPGLVDASDLKTGTVTYNWNVDINNSNAAQYTVRMFVDNYYTGDNGSEPTVIDVAKPLNDFITGGGYQVLQNATGLINPLNGRKNNFGFDVKWNKSGTNLQGNINTIVKGSDGRVYQIKGNSMTSLSIHGASSTVPGTAIFNGKASIQDITDPNHVLPVDGGATLQVTMTDMGDPSGNGTCYDKISITVWNKSGGLWFSSNWNGVKTLEQPIAKGNLKVNSSNSNITGTLQSTMTLTSSLPSVGVNQSVSFTAKVIGSSTSKPSGNVVFIDYTTSATLGTVALNSSTGVATLTTAFTTAVDHYIVAYYSGDSKYASNSYGLTESVTGASTTTSVASRVADNTTATLAPAFNASVYPNPSPSQFNVKLESSNTRDEITIVVYGINGKPVETRQHLTAGQTIQLGANYRPGMYVLEMVQGDQRKQLKLVKLSD